MIERHTSTHALQTISSAQPTATNDSVVPTGQNLQQPSAQTDEQNSPTPESPLFGTREQTIRNKERFPFGSRQGSELFRTDSQGSQPGSPTTPNVRGRSEQHSRGTAKRDETPAPVATSRKKPEGLQQSTTIITLTKEGVAELKGKVADLENRYGADLLVSGKLDQDGELVISIEKKNPDGSTTKDRTYVASLDLFENVAPIINKFSDNKQSTTIMFNGANLSLQPIERWPRIISGVSKLTGPSFLARHGLLPLYVAFTMENKEVSPELEVDESDGIVHSVKFPGYSWVNPQSPKNSKSETKVS